MANPTGKGGFQERPQDINRAGAPKRGQSWQESVKRLTDMTREELIEYVGKSTKIGKLLKELSPNIPVKDALILISIIAYGRDPNPRLLATLMDREEGKPPQSLDLKNSDGSLKPETMKPSEILARADALLALLKGKDGSN
jgi:hypothetical protein